MTVASTANASRLFTLRFVAMDTSLLVYEYTSTSIRAQVLGVDGLALSGLFVEQLGCDVLQGLIEQRAVGWIGAVPIVELSVEPAPPRRLDQIDLGLSGIGKSQ